MTLCENCDSHRECGRSKKARRNKFNSQSYLCSNCFSRELTFSKNYMFEDYIYQYYGYICISCFDNYIVDTPALCSNFCVDCSTFDDIIWESSFDTLIFI